MCAQFGLTIFGVGILLEYSKTKFLIDVVICYYVYLINCHIFRFSHLFICHSYVIMFVCIHTVPYFSDYFVEILAIISLQKTRSLMVVINYHEKKSHGS